MYSSFFLDTVIFGLYGTSHEFSFNLDFKYLLRFNEDDVIRISPFDFIHSNLLAFNNSLQTLIVSSDDVEESLIDFSKSF